MLLVVEPTHPFRPWQMQIEVECIQAVRGHNQCISPYMKFNLGSTYYLNLYLLRYKEVWTILNSGGFLVNCSFYIIEQFSLNTYQLIISKTMRSLRCDGFFKTFFSGCKDALSFFKYSST